MTELKPCPFCGKEDMSDIKSRGCVTGQMIFWVECCMCGAAGPWKPTATEGRRSWDARAQTEADSFLVSENRGLRNRRDALLAELRGLRAAQPEPLAKFDAWVAKAPDGFSCDGLGFPWLFRSKESADGDGAGCGSEPVTVTVRAKR